MANKGYKGMGMDGIIARFYDKNARQYSMAQYEAWAQEIGEQLNEHSHVLEIAPGPGYLAIELAKLDHPQITGLDISETFVHIAQDNAQRAGVAIDFRQGDAAHMPFDEGLFDLIVCTSAFKNFAEPVTALNEMYRVLKATGKAWISDLRHDVTNQAVDDYVKNTMQIKGLGALNMKWTFKHMLRGRAYTKPQFKAFIAQTKFSHYEIQENPMEYTIWLQK
jgi:ubiquinone/menaquinone biosynthesis C-methylase UbiE